MDMERDELLAQLTAIDFTVEDLHLYLDTHPYDQEALMKYNQATMQSRYLRDIYENKYGMLRANNSSSKFPWQWIANPWPWDSEFNFELAGEEE